MSDPQNEQVSLALRATAPDPEKTPTKRETPMDLVFAQLSALTEQVAGVKSEVAGVKSEVTGVKTITLETNNRTLALVEHQQTETARRRALTSRMRLIEATHFVLPALLVALVLICAVAYAAH